ncbi:hypothetical protein DSM106972_057140 [Dulcicalothrix desertica PCC 7102]|uniref:DUF362 domain-containing protein n=1 Tax=Dulcicalothrix desertica PCC 7102 TaxID=232991 RepID=A0A433V9M6_9CYAN|nr:DUF362 domain-containing protein [Dulcicalothrix desertica]RUT02794.1 hypothetical protein DSM106972_057140 [Dulcicalothrix desertica PCC 7102]TWH38972.1 uncharacterized protein (DUF362 family) [Dulcicalothrix desertica PCC 7102]
MKPTSVSLIRANSYDQDSLYLALENLLAPLGGIAAFVKPGDRVLLKPNLLTASKPEKECITRKELVRNIAYMIKAVGGKPFLGDSPTFNTAKGVAKAAGYFHIAKELDMPIVELHSKRYQTENKEFQHLLLSKEAMEADVVINLPKVKSHSQVTLTLGVKNLFGCVPGNTKAWWHMEIGTSSIHFAKMLVETARTISPDLTIIDGIIGHQGNGPSDGEPRYLGLLGASQNVFALDRVIVEILNVDPNLIPTIVAAQQLELCPELATINFPYLRPEELKVFDWQLPSKYIPLDFGLPNIVRSTLKSLFLRLMKERIYSSTEKIN